MPADLVGRAILTELIDPVTKEKVAEKNHKLTPEVMEKILESNIDRFKAIYLDTVTATPVILDTLDMERDRVQRRGDGRNL